MAKYTVNYLCGHSSVVELFGKQTERYKKIEWMEKGLCPECWKAEKAKERQMASEVAANQAKEKGLPALVGSEKQIAWVAFL